MNDTLKQQLVFVAGATGILGGEICRLLIAEGRPVRALVRPTSDAGKVAALKELGIEIVEGDLKDRASLDQALAGVNSVISTVSSTFSRQEGDSIQTVDDDGQINLIDAAVAAGVNEFVFISFCQMKVESPLETAKRKVEKHLAASPLNYTILQPTYFMDIWLSPMLGFDFKEGKATIYGAGKNKISWIAVSDVAFFAVSALDHTNATNRLVELGGPEHLSPLEVVNIFEKVTGRQFELQFVPEEALAAQQQQAADPMSQSFAALVSTVAAGSVIDMKDILADLQKQLTTVEEYATSVNEREMTGASHEDI